MPRAKTLLRLRDAPVNLRLKWIDWYYAHGRNKRKTCRYFGISPTTFYKWFKRYNKRNLSSLADSSRRPRVFRQSNIPGAVTEKIISIRRENMGLSKYKVSKILFRDYGIVISPSTVNRILNRQGLIKEAEIIRGIEKRRSKTNYRIKRLRAERSLRNIAPGVLVQVDTKHLSVLGNKYYQFTAIDTKSKLVCSRVYTTISSSSAQDFVSRMIKRFPFKIKSIQTDNGSEFLKYFHFECQKLGITHYFSRPRTPKDNALVERVIGTIKYELWLFDQELIPELDYLNNKLSWWVGRYNTYRPHQSLDYLTPYEYLQSLNVNLKERSHVSMM